MVAWPTRTEVLGMLLGFLVALPYGYIVRDLTHLHCADSRFSAHLRWDLGVECRK